ncbi:MAG: rRNA maturation RNase YbeY [Candidatus Gracilibacteria bacterium]
MIELIFANEANDAIDAHIFETLLARLPEVMGRLDYEDLELLLTDDSTIHALNKQYRGKDRPTDVLSFSLEDPVHLGQLVISVDRAREQAEQIGQSLEEELRFLFAHGVLHLLGYDHEEPEEEKEMLEKTYALLGRSVLGQPGTGSPRRTFTRAKLTSRKTIAAAGTTQKSNAFLSKFLRFFWSFSMSPMIKKTGHATPATMVLKVIRMPRPPRIKFRLVKMLSFI